MTFLDKLPYTTFINGTEEILVKDILRSVSLNVDDFTVDALLLDYEMQDDERIEDVSYQLYGSSEYHWILLFLNGRKDHLNEFPVRYEILLKLAYDMFENPYATHHFENAEGDVVDFLTFPSYPVSNIEYLVKENDKKRNIKVLRKEYISQFVKTHDQVINS